MSLASGPGQAGEAPMANMGKNAVAKSIGVVKRMFPP